MTVEEFSNAFDVRLASCIKEANFGETASDITVSLNEYEKSIFLTKAQGDIIIAYFEPGGNKLQQGFDDSIKRQYDFSSLIIAAELETYSDSTTQFDKRSKRFITPSDMFLSINEQIVDSTGRIYTIVPISFMQYNRLMAKPYGYPIKRQAWRMIVGKTDDNVQIYEVIGRFKGDISYCVRYVKRPHPIVLVDLDSVQEGLSIEGYDTVTECELPENVHAEILQRAVELAKASYQLMTEKGGNMLQNMLAVSQASMTGIGQGQPANVRG